MNKRIEFVSGFIIFILIVCFLIFDVYLWISYGDKPIDEIPFWVLWFLWGRK